MRLWKVRQLSNHQGPGSIIAIYQICWLMSGDRSNLTYIVDMPEYGTCEHTSALTSLSCMQANACEP